MRLSGADEAIVAENAAAIRMRVSELVGGGLSLKAAKAAAIKGYAMKGVPEDLRPHVVWLVESMPPADIDPVDAVAAARRTYAGGVDAGLIRDTLANRLLWRLFGVTL